MKTESKVVLGIVSFLAFFAVMSSPVLLALISVAAASAAAAYAVYWMVTVLPRKIVAKWRNASLLNPDLC